MSTMVRTVALVLFVQISLYAQLTDTGTIVGTVSDQTGAAVPGAKVTAINLGTNAQQTTTTDTAGQYVIPSLKVATYSLTVEKTGFQTFFQSGIILDVQSRVAIDVHLQIGEVSQKIQVSAASPLLETQNANVGQVVSSRTVDELPLNGRQYTQLALLTAGVFVPTATLQSAGEGYFAVNGNFSTQNNFILDGVDNNSYIENFQARSAEAGHVPVDALAEFKLQTRTYDAEFGRAEGGVVNAQIKSGTNALHGDAWDFLRNSALDANDFFLNRAGAGIPEFQQNQFGGTVGMPIVKEKAFVFAAFEGLRIKQSQAQIGTVPTPLMRELNFSELATPPTSPTIPGLSQFSGCITNAVLSAACVDPSAAKLYALYPMPNTNLANQGILGSFAGNNYISAGPSPISNDNVVVRADQNIGQRDRLFEHYSVLDDSEHPSSIFGAENPIADGGGYANYVVRNQNAALGLTHIFNPTTVFDFRAGFNRLHEIGTQRTFSENVDTQYGIYGVPYNPLVGGGLPEIDVSGLSNLGAGRWVPEKETSYVWQFRGLISKIKSRHTIKGGVEYRDDADNYLDNESNRGAYTFSGQYTGAGVTDFLLGSPNYAGLDSVDFVRKYQTGLFFFGQDTWRVSDKLSINYGLRYEYASPFLNRNNALTNFNPSLNDGQGGLYQPPANATDTATRATVQPYKKGFQPRFGLAYQITHKLVFRGGFGLFDENYDRRGNLADLSLNPPMFVDKEVNWASNEAPSIFLQNGFPPGYIAPVDISNPAEVGALFLHAQQQNTVYGRIEQYSGGFEYSISPNLVLSASWVGNYGHHLWRAMNINQKDLTAPGQPSGDIPFPEFRVDPSVPPVDTLPTPIQTLTSNGNSNYNAMLISLQRRYSEHLSFTLSYTVSKWLSDFTPELDSALGKTDEAQNVYDLKAEKGLTGEDTPQRLVFSGSYILPVGRGAKHLTEGVAGRVLEGWQPNVIVTAQRGQPLEIIAPYDTSATGQVRSEGRADCIGKPKSITSTVDEWFDTSAFAVPSAFYFGSCSVAPGPRMDGIVNLDFSLFKRIPITESKYLQFRAEFFNFLNHPNFSAPGNTAGVPGFGAVTSMNTIPREIQFALKFYF